jgi:hypothetical protein
MRLFADENLEAAVDEQAERLLGVFTVIEAAAIRRRPFLALLK